MEGRGWNGREKGTQQIQYRPISELRPYERNARTHSRKQIDQIATSIERFGFTNPVLISDDGQILAGHGRVQAARKLGQREVPTLALSQLDEAERRAYVLADYKLALNAGWDQEILAIELQALVDLEFDVEITGFSLAEIDLVLEGAAESRPDSPADPEDAVPPVGGIAISSLGDLWSLGRHRLLCGDARDDRAYEALLGADRVDLMFTDPPYNVPIDGHVCGLGKVRHREFAMASGEMSQATFTQFLTDALAPAAAVCRDGAIAFVCMDWRHMGELLAAGRTAFDEFKNLGGQAPAILAANERGFGRARSRYALPYPLQLNGWCFCSDNAPEVASVRAAPTGHRPRLVTARQGQSVSDHLVPIFVDVATLKMGAKKIGPDELGERPRLLGIAAHFAHRTGKRAKRIIAQFGNLPRNVGIGPAIAIGVERMQPAAVVEEAPEMLLLQLMEIGDHCDQNLILALVVKRASKMVMINNERPPTRANHHRNHVPPEKRRSVVAHRQPLFSLGLDLA